MIKSTRIARTALILLFALAANSQADYTADRGRGDSRYRITTVADWQQLMDTPADWDKHFILTADLDLQDIPLSPIGNDANNFTGIFDGNDHIIRNADINAPAADYVGLFGYIGRNSQIASLGVENIAIKGKDYVGGLAGRANAGNIVLCYTTGSVAGVKNVGGLIGYEDEGILTACYSAASVLGAADYTGGLVGFVDSDTINACYATGEVTGNSYVGGLLGVNYGTTTACYATGAVTGDFVVAGLVGHNGAGIFSSYSTGFVSGSSSVGGFVGGADSRRGGASFACFWDKDTSGRTTSDGGEPKTTDQMQDPNTFLSAGWDFTDEDGDLAHWFIPENDYPRLAVSSWPWTNVPDITGMSLLDAATTLRNAGFPVGSSEWVAGQTVPPDHIVSQYPIAGFKGVQGITEIDLKISIATQFSAGDGSEDDPYQIKTAAEWVFLAANSGFWDEHLILIADIDFAGAPVSPIGYGARNGFSGVLDGNGHVVSNIRINMPETDVVGLFGSFRGRDAQIRNLGVEKISVIGYEGVGGLVAYLGYGSISGCYVTGTVTGYRKVGGLFGYAGDFVPEVSDCYAAVTVSGDTYVGGLGGLSQASLRHCYSTGLVQGETDVGGLVGAGPDDDVFGCFWDVNTSGQSASAAGVGKTTAQMKDIDTYLSADWDFTTEDFAPPDWVMPESEYPHLAWQYWENATIPDVNEMPFDQAAAALKAAGFFVGSLSGIVSPTVPLGCIVRQSPLPDSNGIRGIAKVDIVISYRNEFADGNGAEDDPYRIAAVEDWLLLTDTPESWSEHFILTADLDFFGGGIPPIVSDPRRSVGFDGVLDGNEHAVRNIILNVQEYMPSGLFTDMNPNGRIRNIRVENIYIVVNHRASLDAIGGLVGMNRGTIANCHLSGRIDGFGASSRGGGMPAVGSLVGYNYGSITACSASGRVGNGDPLGGLVGYNRGNIADCYADTNIWGTAWYSGALVGYNYGDIANSCATGNSTADGRTAGLIGLNSGAITNCYAAGSVIDGPDAGGLVARDDSGTVTASFWDKDTSGQPTSAGGEAKTTAQMQDPNTFISAGWDFLGEEGNGTDDIWAICDGTNYPRLVWRIPATDWLCPDGVGLEDFTHLAGLWGTPDAGSVNLDGQTGIGFNDLKLLCEQWLTAR